MNLESVPREYAEGLQDQLDAAMQIIAALVLTDEEVIAIQTKADPSVNPKALIGWAEGMRKELLDPNNEFGRPRLVEVIQRQGFLANTHSGYCTGPLLAPLPGAFHVAEVTKALVKATDAYARGEGPEAPDDALDEMLAARDLVRAAVEPGPYPKELARSREAVIDWLFSPHGVGRIQMLRAMRHRLMSKVVPPPPVETGARAMQQAVLSIFSEVMPRLQGSPSEQWAHLGRHWLSELQRRVAELDPVAVVKPS